MASLKFRTIKLSEKENSIMLELMGNFYTLIPKEELGKIGKFSIKNDGSIEFDTTETRANNKFHIILNKYLSQLRSKITDNEAIYIHSNSGIPLIGSNFFGIVDRNTNLLEVKMSTGCNFNCIYCSVNEGLRSKMRDFVVETEYLIAELKKVIEIKESNDIEVHIGTQGEPLLFGDLEYLIKKIAEFQEVKRISMDTNGMLLTKERIDKLIRAGMTQFNISLNSLDERTAYRLAGRKFKLSQIIESCKYISTKKIKLVIAPVLVPGYNEGDMEDLIGFAKKINATIAIQNFLNYKHGRNPVKQWSWKKFYGFLKDMEKKHQTKLIFKPKDFGIYPLKKLNKPFKKGNIVNAEIISPGRNKNDILCKSNNRVISAIGDFMPGKKVRLKITRDKHNIYWGKII